MGAFCPLTVTGPIGTFAVRCVKVQRYDELMEGNASSALPFLVRVAIRRFPRWIFNDYMEHRICSQQTRRSGPNSSDVSVM